MTLDIRDRCSAVAKPQFWTKHPDETGLLQSSCTERRGDITEDSNITGKHQKSCVVQDDTFNHFGNGRMILGL
ncbi:hypothetical protein J6590_107034 [Homalodisca vitripennis]|nr:hypothetical protein J6590_107034 [Homalodisca vitripennis]